MKIRSSAIKEGKRIGLVLGSGSARGLAHIGVIKLLEEQHIRIDAIAGTSIGAFIGGLYACGISVKEMEAILSGADKLMVARMLMPGFSIAGLVDNARVRHFIKGLVGDKKIEKLAVPFAAVATDLVTGEEVVFDKGSLVDAILASIAIPTIFQPVQYKDRFLVDGALSNPLPVNVVRTMRVQRTIAVNVSPNPARTKRILRKKKTPPARQLDAMLPKWLTGMIQSSGYSIPRMVLTMPTGRRNKETPPSLVRVLLQSISISTNNLIAERLKQSPADVVISPSLEEFDMMAFYRGTEIAQRGYEAAVKALPQIDSLR